MDALTEPARPVAAEAHALSDGEVCARLGVDARTGLSDAEGARRLNAEGPNELGSEPAPSRFALVARQFGNSMVLLLVGAAAISLSIGELLDAGVILAIVIANAIFGAVQEGRADQAAAAVRALLAPTAHVLRDGHVSERPAAVVVPGDVVALRAGDRIAADGRAIDSTLLQVDESALTGESLARGSESTRPIRRTPRWPNVARPCSRARRSHGVLAASSSPPRAPAPRWAASRAPPGGAALGHHCRPASTGSRGS
jgi:magnesium-transporting ATPase (P-type)